jgi:hypothetical protein
MNLKLNWDAMGITASVICAIHCAVLPMTATLLPAVINNHITHNGYFEWTMILIAFLIGSYALSHGYRKHHHSLKPILVFSLGFIFLAAKQFSAYHLILMLIAVTLIVWAHLMNFRLCHKSKCSDPHHKH